MVTNGRLSLSAQAALAGRHELPAGFDGWQAHPVGPRITLDYCLEEFTSGRFQAGRDWPAGDESEVFQGPASSPHLLLVAFKDVPDGREYQVVDLVDWWAAARAGRLAGVDAGRMVLSGADLVGANLTGTNFHAADLVGADLRGANLRGAYMVDAYMAGARLAGADLTGANLYGADLRRANLEGADLTRATLAGVDLRDTYLGDVVWTDVYLSGTNLPQILAGRPGLHNLTTFQPASLPPAAASFGMGL